ncbi:peptidase domain-containing ABC transporter [Hydrogenophaga laconesensis]|uniref:Subfamily B ATP-binding cassette protein HlyB/CyaB n=1 Tax=Hydrogenophaga laconesensis TaxID=1805971 RepID=A0ABU1VIF0_9BURK|nr:type I secretion system permease/ATPase [Hydrogenophaga laconesensis]MDR7097219.1 subfamily B ATP-binding cassette protein HlyB/CyaB [Hydrogenophaga laconesensis]
MSELKEAAQKPSGGSCANETWSLLASFVGLMGMPVDAAVLRAQGVAFAQAPNLAAMARALTAVGLSVQPRRGGPGRLAEGVPVLTTTASGRALLVSPLGGDEFLVQAAGESAPSSLDTDALQALWTGEWLEARRGAAQAADAEHRVFGMDWFWRSLSRHKGILGEVLLASLFVQVFALVTPLIFQVVIDKVLAHRSMATLDVLVIALLGLGVFEVVLGAMRHYLFSHTTHRVDVELGSRLFRHLIHLPMSYFGARRTGDTVARVRELENARNFLTGTALTGWLDLAFAVVFLAVMFHYSATLTLIVVAALPVLFAASWIVTPLLRSKLEDKFALGAENQTFLQETVGAMETLKGQAVETAWQREWERRQADYVHAAFASGHVGNATQQFMGLASKVLTVLLLYFGARLVIDNELTVGGLIAFNMLAGRVNAPILKLASVWQEVTQMKVSVKRLAEIMDAPVEPAFRPGRSVPPSLKGGVTLEHVTFRYAPHAPEVLSDLSLDVKPGEIVGITGVSGSGKTTLTRLIQRLYVPERGRVLIDGMDLALMDASWLRRQIGVVSQDVTLFNRSVRENIALGRADLPMEKIMDAAKLAGAHDFVLQLPQGYDTVIGERGSQLSGGQRARLAIARALAGDPCILLFDEATASLDYDSERAVHDNMARICEGRTVFIVAHRLSTLRLADRVLVLDKGRLVESGHHRDLLRMGGRYASLYRSHQVLEAA